MKKLRHEGGYTPFTVDVTDDVSYGGTDNLIALKTRQQCQPGLGARVERHRLPVPRRALPRRQPPLTNSLHVTDAVYADKAAGGGVFVTYPAVEHQSATVAIRTNVINEDTDPEAGDLVSEIVDPSGAVVGSASADAASVLNAPDHDFIQSVAIQHPNLWHPNTPNLYTLATTVKRARPWSVTKDADRDPAHRVEPRGGLSSTAAASGRRG